MRNQPSVAIATTRTNCAVTSKKIFDCIANCNLSKYDGEKKIKEIKNKLGEEAFLKSSFTLFNRITK